MRSIKKLRTSLVLLLVLSVPTATMANPGKYLNLEKGQIVPWRAWCFDEIAIANIISEKELAQKKCELKIEKEKELQKAQFDLDIGKLQAEMDYEIGTRQATIESLKKENLKLEQIIIDNSNPDALTMISIGIVIGALTTVAVMGLAQ